MIRTKRKRLGLTQMDLAKKLGFKSYIPIQKIEDNKGDHKVFVEANKVLEKALYEQESTIISSIIKEAPKRLISIIDNRDRNLGLRFKTDFIYYSLIHNQAIGKVLIMSNLESILTSDHDGVVSEYKEAVELSEKLNHIFK